MGSRGVERLVLVRELMVCANLLLEHCMQAHARNSRSERLVLMMVKAKMH